MTTELMDGLALAADTLSEVTQDVAESFAAMGIGELILPCGGSVGRTSSPVWAGT
jgi:hypothetical protein